MNLITQKLRLVDVEFSFSVDDLVKELLKDPGVPYRKAEEIPLYRRFDVQERMTTKGLLPGQVKHYVTTLTVDTYGEVVLPKGGDLKFYKRNPMVLWSHNYKEPENVMGSNLSIEIDEKGMLVLTQFALTEEKAARVYRLYKEGHLRAWSIGFIPIKGTAPDDEEKKKWSKPEGDKGTGPYSWIPDPDKVKYVHEKWRLLEYSAVAVPANPDALTVAVAKGFDIGDSLLRELELKQEAIDQIVFEEAAAHGKSVDYFDLRGDKDKDEKQTDVGSQEKKETPAAEGTPAARCCGDEGLTWESVQGLTAEEFKALYEGGQKVDDDYVMKPYPNEHSCRLRDPGDFQKGSFRSYERDHNGKKYRVIAGRLKGKTTMTEQAFRYPKDTWTASDAKAHCKDHNGIAFEPASGKSCGGEHEYLLTKVEEDKEKKIKYLTLTCRHCGEFMVTCNFDPTEELVRITPEMWRSMTTELKELRLAIAEERAGAVLSSKNRALVEAALEAMTKAAGALQSANEALTNLLEGAKKPDDKKEAVIELKSEEEGIVVSVTDVEKTAKEVAEKLDLGELLKDAVQKYRKEPQEK